MVDVSQNDFLSEDRFISSSHGTPTMFALLARTVLTYVPDNNVFGNQTTEGLYPSVADPRLPSARRSLHFAASPAVAL
jgi:hypothetical protein